MNHQEKTLEILKQTTAYFNGHFVLSSGLHSDSYVQCAQALQHPIPAENLGIMLAEKIRATLGDVKIAAVIGPAMGGIIIAHELARALGVRAMFMERVEGTFKLRRGFKIGDDEAVVLCEDVVTTGGSVREVADILAKSGKKVLAISSIVDRSGGTVKFDVPFIPLASLTIPVWKPEECPLCAKNIEITKPGSRGLKS